MQLKKTNITVVLPSAEAQREMKEHIQAPERFSCHWLIKSPALLCGLRRGASGNDRGTETKHPVRFSIKVLGPFQTTLGETGELELVPNEGFLALLNSTSFRLMGRKERMDVRVSEVR